MALSIPKFIFKDLGIVYRIDYRPQVLVLKYRYCLTSSLCMCPSKENPFLIYLSYMYIHYFYYTIIVVCKYNLILQWLQLDIHLFQYFDISNKMWVLLLLIAGLTSEKVVLSLPNYHQDHNIWYLAFSRYITSKGFFNGTWLQIIFNMCTLVSAHELYATWTRSELHTLMKFGLLWRSQVALSLA